MKDKWLKDLHDRMSEFKMDAPDDLWAEIEKAERKRNPNPGIWIRMKRYASIAAASIAVLIIGRYILFSKDSDVPLQLTTTQDHAPELISQVEEHSKNAGPSYQSNLTTLRLTAIKSAILPPEVEVANIGHLLHQIILPIQSLLSAYFHQEESVPI